MKKKQKCLFNFQEIGLECHISKVCCTSCITAAYMPLWDLLHWAHGQPLKEKLLFVWIHKSCSIKKEEKNEACVSGVFSWGKLISDLWFWPKQTAISKEAIICWLKMINSVVFLLDLLLYLSVTHPSVISFQPIKDMPWMISKPQLSPKDVSVKESGTTNATCLVCCTHCVGNLLRSDEPKTLCVCVYSNCQNRAFFFLKANPLSSPTFQSLFSFNC